LILLGITDLPFVKVTLGAIVVLYIANLDIAISIRAALQTGAVQIAGFLGVIVLGWVFTGMPGLRK